jgi:hypothetical protein
MKMTIQTIDPQHYVQTSRQIRAKVSTVLTKFGLLPRFKRWRLTQDPDTGMIVLFGILNNRYIATHTTIPFSDYFDPRVLRELANELQIQIVSCNSDGLRYAFILDRGQIGKLPTHIDYPFIDNGKLMVRVVYRNDLQPIPVPPETVDDQKLVQAGVGAFLKVFDDIKLREDAAIKLSEQKVPDIMVIEESEFEKRITEFEIDRKRRSHIRELFE